MSSDGGQNCGREKVLGGLVWTGKRQDKVRGWGKQLGGGTERRL